MLFKGRLRLPSDAGEGIPIDLTIEDVFLSLDSGGEDFGEWRLDTVEIKRLFSNQFSLLLDGEEMVFIADDALGFAYEGLAAVEDVQGRLSKRRLFKGRKSPKKKTLVAPDSGTGGPESETPDEPPAVETRPDVPMPEVVPFFPEAAPSFADSVAESAVVDESIAPIAPRPIEIAEANPPPAPRPSPPAPPEAPVDPVPVDSPVPADIPIETEEPAAMQEPVPAGDQTEDSDSDDDFEIEDVSAFGYVPVATAHLDESREPQRRPEEVEEALPEDDDEFEIEDAIAGAGAVLREVHPLGDPAPGDSSSQPSPASEAEPLAEPEPMPEAAPPAPTPEPEAPPAEPERSGIQYDPVPLPPDPQPSFAQWSSNGSGRTEPDPTVAAAPNAEDEEKERATPRTQKSGRHARSSSRSKSSLFGRKKSREPEEHEHRYESSKTVGGITRRICAICGHVSFAGEDVYQNW